MIILLQVTVKDEEDMVDSPDIFAQVSCVNTYTCNYSTIESWIWSVEPDEEFQVFCSGPLL